MKTKVRFKCVTVRGKIKHITFAIEHPEFKPLPKKMVCGYEFPETSVRCQIVDFIDNLDKTDFMNENDVHCILDYTIVEKREKITLMQLIEKSGMQGQFLIDFLATASEIKPQLKGQTAKKQFELIVSHMRIGVKAQKTAYQCIIDMYKGFEERKKEIKIEKTKSLS